MWVSEVSAELGEIEKELGEIHSLLKRLPEIQAGVFLRMYEEAQAAKLQGKSLRDIWSIAPPEQR